MYRYLDRQVDALAEPDRFVLAAIRQWAHAAATGRCACSVIGRGFERRGIVAAARDFAMAIAALHVDGIAVMKLGQPCDIGVTEDEARLLAAFAAGREGDAAGLERIAQTLVSPDAAGRFATAVHYFGAALAAGAHA